MKLSLLKNQILEKLNLVSKFTSNKLSSLTALQGVLIDISEEKINFYATNLNSYIHTSIQTKLKEKIKFVIDPKKITEFISLLTSASVDFEVRDNQLIISSGKTKGNFPLLNANDFPLPPNIKEKKEAIDKNFFINNLPLVLFSASYDETRPVLTGVNFITTEEESNIVATDGFRLSLIKIEDKINFPSLILPADFLNELIRFLKTETDKDAEQVLFGYSAQEKNTVFEIGENKFYSRLIEGEYPPFEKVIPQETVTKVNVDKEELIRNIKLVSVFARDYSNIIIFDVKKDGLYLRPKMESETGENGSFQEAEFEGKEQKIAFNYRFVLEFLNHIDDKKVIIEILRPDAPAIFKLEKNPKFIHLIMPVRIETG